MAVADSGRRNLAIVALLCVLASSCNTAEAYGLNQKLLLISFDGFRQLYFDDNIFLPWFSYFREGGVYSDQVQSVFPSETFPNHWSIVTGMYAESHGVVANSMYDPNLNKTFHKSDLDPVWWNQAEPIWVTARKQGNKRTAISFWPGSAVKFPPNDYTPDYYEPIYDESIPFELRINKTINHLAYDDVDLGIIYFYQPDSDEHEYGAPSKNAIAQLQAVDWYLSYILERLEQVGLGEDDINIVICADHGMVNVTSMIQLQNYVDIDSNVERVPSYGPIVSIEPKPGKTEDVVGLLAMWSESGAPFTVYRKHELPASYHYANNDRIPDVVVECKLGTYMTPREPTWLAAGTHGYNPAIPSMKPLFLARGPAFKKDGYKAENMFQTKDIYAIVSYVVGIEPAATNASFDAVADLFAESHAHHLTQSATASVVVVLLSFFAIAAAS